MNVNILTRIKYRCQFQEAFRKERFKMLKQTNKQTDKLRNKQNYSKNSMCR